jgi:hypothetical protein
VQRSKGIRLVETFTGGERGTLTPAKLSITALAFAPDGKSLLIGTVQGDVVVLGLDGKEAHRSAAAHKGFLQAIHTTKQGKVITVGSDQAVLVWSEELWQKRASAPAKLLQEDLDLFYNILVKKEDPNIAPTMASLIAAGDVTTAFLKDKLVAAQQPSKPRTPTSPPPPAEIRDWRLIEILEGIGTPAAREILQRLAQGHADAFLTREAKESLQRLPLP